MWQAFRRSKTGGWLKVGKPEATRPLAVQVARAVADVYGVETGVAQIGGASRKIRNKTRARRKSVQKAAAVVKRFTGRPARRVSSARVPDALALLGDCVAIEYRSDKWDGKSRIYRHECKRGVRLFGGDDGRSLVVSGGRLRITPRGIEG